VDLIFASVNYPPAGAGNQGGRGKLHVAKISDTCGDLGGYGASIGQISDISGVLWCGVSLGVVWRAIQVRVVLARQARTPISSMLVSMVTATMASTRQSGDWNVALISASLTRRGPSVPGCRSLKHSMW
jgi:hypothetical protein